MALALVGGCQANGPVDEPPAKKPLELAAPVATGHVECAGACRVDLFDGTALRPLTVDSDGAVQVPAQAGVIFVSAPGQIPQVKFVSADQPLGTVRLEAAPDPLRGGYLAVAAVKVFTGGKRGGATQLVPVPAAELGLLLGRARSVLVTDQTGVLVTHMPANSYALFAGGARHEVQVPQGGTAVLPLVMGTTRVD
jgi:hypothetical protein